MENITLNLPDWAKYNKQESIVEVKPSVVYPMYLKKLGWENQPLTQSRLEVARRCFTEDLKIICGGTLGLRILREMKFALKNFPAGQPLSFRAEWKRINKKK